MSTKKPGSVLVKRPQKIVNNDVRTASETSANDAAAWVDPSETAELELISTQTLKQILSSSDTDNCKAIEEAAKSNAEGVLARDPATGFFEIVGDGDLQAILDSNSDLPTLRRPTDVTRSPLRDYADADHVSLVSTHALRKVFENDEDVPAEEINEASEFDPYSHD